MNFWAIRRLALLLTAGAAFFMYGCGDGGRSGGGGGGGGDGPVNPPNTAKYSVEVESDGYSPTGGGSYAAGATVSISAGTVSEDKKFLKWSSSSEDVVFAGESNPVTTFKMPAHDVKVTAEFGVREGYYKVEVVSAGKGATGAGNYKKGDTVKIYAGTAPKEGSQFKEWNVERGGVKINAVKDGNAWFEMPDSAVKVKAEFEAMPGYNAVEVESPAIDAEGGGYYKAGNTVTISAGTAPEGWRFKIWTSAPGSNVAFDNPGSVKTTFTMPMAAPGSVITVTAVFEKVPMAATVISSDDAIMVSGGGNYGAGDTVYISTAEIPLNSDKQFGKWSSDSKNVVFADSQNATTTFIMPGNAVTVTANFAPAMEIKMVYVKGGKFTMGCTPRNGDKCANDERPPHDVTVGDFYIGKYEVTLGLWKSVMNSPPQSATGNPPMQVPGDDYPVYGFDWHQAWTFVERLNQKTKKNYRLPTEAEWEYAARGGSNGGPEYLYSGSDIIDKVAWYQGNNNTNSGVKRVGTKSPNALNIYDMSGNVYEYVMDGYDAGYYSVSPSDNPSAPADNGQNNVYRGGSYEDLADNCRVSFRGVVNSHVAKRGVGFRLVLDAAQ